MKRDTEKIFGRRVRERRIALKLTQQELADRSGLQRSYIGEVELGKRNITLKNIEKIAQALETDIASLVGK